jgi:hypothetical protein
MNDFEVVPVAPVISGIYIFFFLHSPYMYISMETWEIVCTHGADDDDDDALTE